MTNEGKILISGRVTDFDNNPLQNAVVEIKNARFDAIYKANTNDKGQYEIFVEKGVYLALMVCKDYKTKYLEYWAWNIPAYQDLQFNPRIDGIEVYAMNAFVPQGAYPSLIIYFRPMSLKRTQEAGGSNALKNMKVVDISPDLSEDDIELKINGTTVKILEINRVKEYADGISSMIAYLIQSTMPRKSIIAYLIQSALPLRTPNSKRYSEYLQIDLTLRDKKTGEKGEGCLFWKRQQTKSGSL
jgi:hypothetical protein